VQAYYAACRGAGRLREAIATGWASGAVALVAAAIAAGAGGLDAMAVAWLLVQVATAVLAALRLRRLNRSRDAAGTPAPVVVGETGLPAVVPPA
jgi:hypothetical protein